MTKIRQSTPIKQKPNDESASIEYMILIRRFPLMPIVSKDEFRRASDLFSELTLDKLKLKKTEEAYRQVLGTLIADYERRHRKPITGNPVEVIQAIMEIHALKQSDLISEFGTKSLVSEFLSGKRSLSKDQIIRLCKRFSLSPSALMPELS